MVAIRLLCLISLLGAGFLARAEMVMGLGDADRVSLCVQDLQAQDGFRMTVPVVKLALEIRENAVLNKAQGVVVISDVEVANGSHQIFVRPISRKTGRATRAGSIEVTGGSILGMKLDATEYAAFKASAQLGTMDVTVTRTPKEVKKPIRPDDLKPGSIFTVYDRYFMVIAKEAAATSDLVDRRQKGETTAKIRLLEFPEPPRSGMSSNQVRTIRLRHWRIDELDGQDLFEALNDLGSGVIHISQVIGGDSSIEGQFQYWNGANAGDQTESAPAPEISPIEGFVFSNYKLTEAE